MYLVLLRHTMDDLPVRLCKTRAEANEVAVNLDEMPSDGIRDLFGTDCSTPVNVCIVRFNDSGVPVKMNCVRNFDDEPAVKGT